LCHDAGAPSFHRRIGEANICPNIQAALDRAREIKAGS
jgi:hypothetical protein